MNDLQFAGIYLPRRCTHWLTHSLTHPLTYSLTHSLTYPLTHSFNKPSIWTLYRYSRLLLLAGSIGGRLRTWDGTFGIHKGEKYLDQMDDYARNIFKFVLPLAGNIRTVEEFPSVQRRLWYGQFGSDPVFKTESITFTLTMYLSTSLLGAGFVLDIKCQLSNRGSRPGSWYIFRYF
jgi:hypothetical protein